MRRPCEPALINSIYLILGQAARWRANTGISFSVTRASVIATSATDRAPGKKCVEVFLILAYVGSRLNIRAPLKIAPCNRVLELRHVIMAFRNGTISFYFDELVERFSGSWNF